MTQLILNFQNDLEPAGGMMISSSLAGSHNYANLTVQQESDSAKRMRDTSGQKCLEQLERLNHVGSWAKTFTGLLIGQKGWYSTRCKLTWKLKGTKYNRIYCQLYPSTLPIEETGYGLLLKTPTTMDGEVSSGKKNPVSGNSGTLAQEIMSGYQPTMMKLGLLPTPRTLMPTDAQDTIVINGQSIRKNGKKFGVNLETLASRQLLPTPTTQEPTSECQVNENGRRVTASGDSHSLNLGRLAGMGMLPTPCRFDYNSARTEEKWEEDKAKYAEQGVNLQMGLKQMARFEMLPTPKTQDSRHAMTDRGKSNLGEEIAQWGKDTGQSSHLSPQFVLEMMGFPTDWTELPFLNGETKA